ncbi:MAG: 23S rRNA pseudouridine(2604) synthase RluF [Prevotella sp.]|jgi:23S rRNA pseudouridine2604 synthase|nr:23S rRNA pseudouridine(2604) synthase RluF [Prevotella sp.]
MRINKYISDSGYCSRREADKLIEQGNVTINGKKATIGSQVLDGQEVKIYGETIINNNRPIFIAYNKPLGIVSTTDPDEPSNILDAVGHEERIFPIGRLDKDSQGLIILTNDGDIVNKMLRADNNHEKEYSVVVDRLINEDFVNKMQNGVPILGVVTRKCEVVKTGTHSFNIVLRQGLNRQIRRMCEYLGYKVLRLERIRIMHIKLGNIKIGQWKNLTQEEVDTLRKKTASSTKTDISKKKANPQGAKMPQFKSKSANTPNKEWNKPNKQKENKTGQRIGKTKATPRGRSQK